MSPAQTDTTLTLDAKYTRLEGSVFMTGVQALVRLPLEQMRRDRRAGVDTAMLVTGYQGSPLGGFDLELQRHSQLLEEHRVHHVPALNEELAATAVLGSQQASSLSGARYDGVAALWYGKAPGLDRATDAIRHGNMIGVDRLGGAVLAVGDDALSKSSTLPSSSEATFFDTLVPFLAPADPQEVLDLGLHAVALSRASGLWAGIKISTNVADGSGTVRVDPGRVMPAMPQAELDGEPYRHRVDAKLVAPVPQELERTLYSARLEAARRYGVLNDLNSTHFAAPGDRLGILAAGKTYLELRGALTKLGLDEEALRSGPVRLLKVSMPFPLDPGVVREFAAGLEEVIVVEDKRPFLELLVKDALYGSAAPPRVVGKRDEDGAPLISAEKEVDADVALAALAPRLRRYCEVREPSPPVELAVLAPGSGKPPAAPRLPWFCSGCPHSTSTKVPDGTLVGGGIGCHALVLLMSPQRVGEIAGVTQMGGEGAQWIGMAPFVSTEHFVQNIGDGTFLHSGSLALRAAVAAGVNVTYKVLWNSAVAMTGGQHAVGALDVPRLTRLLEDEGVARTIVTTDDRSRYRRVRLARNAEVWDRSRVVEAQEALAAVPGVTVMIHDQECAAERRRRRKRGKAPEPPQRVFVNERVCEGCGDCGAKSNCLSVQPVETEFGEKTRIDQASCNKDFTCLQGDCPSFLTVVPGAKKSKRAAPATLAAGELPEPPPATAPTTIRIVGMGGTGVVTVAQVLGTAAFLDGLTVRGLDQTGMAQKGGPVVSDLRLFAAETEASNKAAQGECDLYLGCDVLVAAEARHLSAAAPGHTTAVVATTEVSTGPMVSDPGKHFPPLADLHERIDAATDPARNAYLDPRAIANRLFGSDRAANVLLLGVACQLGTLPIGPAAIEQAIELNGASVAENLQAFRRGRQWVIDRAAVEAAAESTPRPADASLDPDLAELVATVGAPPGSELERLLRVRVPELAGYQSRRYARDYADLVARVRAVEEERVGSTELSEAVAANLFKLMAYKDEYEVARLHLDPALREAIRRDFGEGARLHWHLHPPLLRALGMKRKLRLGAWFAGPYRLLRAMRRLRGTPFDPFGRAEVRRVERALVEEYRETVAGLLTRLAQENHAECVEIAALPQMIRGYEQIKLDNVARYRERLAQLSQPPHRDLEESHP